jgi:hypothetical protein
MASKLGGSLVQKLIYEYTEKSIQLQSLRPRLHERERNKEKVREGRERPVGGVGAVQIEEEDGIGLPAAAAEAQVEKGHVRPSYGGVERPSPGRR